MKLLTIFNMGTILIILGVIIPVMSFITMGLMDRVYGQTFDEVIGNNTHGEFEKFLTLYGLTADMTQAEQEEFYANLANIMNISLPEQNLTQSEKAILNLTPEESKNNLKKLVNITNADKNLRNLFNLTGIK